jgi:DNA-binding beta-propeller fold protein YncE
MAQRSRRVVGVAAALAAIAMLPAPAFARPGVAAYVPNENTSSISQFAVGPHGLLTGLAPFTIPTVSYVTGHQDGAAVSRNGRALYVPDANGIEQYAIGSTGALTPMNPAWIPSGTLLDCGCVSQGSAEAQAVAVSPNGRYVYVTNDDGPGDITEYSVAGNGSLSPLPGTDNVTTGVGDLIGLAISADGRYLYANSPSEIVALTVAGSGQLALNPAGATYDPYFDGLTGSIILSADGRSAYVPAFNTIQESNIAPNGTLSPKGRSGYVTFAPGGDGQEGIALGADGWTLYATDADDNTVTLLIVGPNGALVPTKVAVPTTGVAPGSITISADGRTLYVTNTGDSQGDGSAISVYAVGLFGGLTPESSPAIGDASPVTLVLAND